jgi:hypothetical protein
MFGTRTSTTYLKVPKIFSAMSVRLTDVPTIEYSDGFFGLPEPWTSAESAAADAQRLSEIDVS